ncbi:hypothetical protein [Psychromicrobium xiongbiense]|uniref:hypothetical protein n=1 Tax=Psychromicrobium xiongbiense TaxID=3051184 RepID=UPI002552CCE7|nr:hypothetical protein [Psychromicrobium sp. YIM S02556]
MNQDEFTKLFTYMQDMRGDLQQEIRDLRAETTENTDRILTVLDASADRTDADETERAALTAQVDRHEDWIVASAPKVGVGYPLKSI